MDAYGYSEDPNNPEKLVRLSDLAFDGDPSELRVIGNFLLLIADEVESGVLQNSHIHIGMKVKNWGKLVPHLDIQIINRNYPGPAIYDEIQNE